ncbi:MAG: DUF4159 domain-containing protein, partial [Planctomycetaceae bacterium]
LCGTGTRVRGEDPLRQPVLNAIEIAKRFLLRQQRPDGSWASERGNYAVGIHSLVLLALLNTGMTAQDQQIQKGLEWLRANDSETTYEISLKIQALAAAKDSRTDVARVVALVNKLENQQLQNGSWTYGRNVFNVGSPAGDRSNAQFAVLGLREAQEMGAHVRLEVWRKAREHFVRSQNPDGGWDYSDLGRGASIGSMTVAGLATVVITDAMLKAEENHLDADGSPRCCLPPLDQKVLEAAERWMGNNFAVRFNPSAGRGTANNRLLYYLYGLERAGRFSGRRFFVNSRGDQFDWYREGAEFLVSEQNRVNGTWQGAGDGENDPLVGTSLSLIFLSKGLAPVLINKLSYGPRDPRTKQLASRDWNLHADDVRNLTQQISSLPKWPKLLNWQSVDVAQATLGDLMQAPIVSISGRESPQFADRDLDLLREYIVQGGFILAINNCNSAAFDEGFREVVRQLYPPSEARLQKLKADHPVFRAEYDLIDKRSGEPSVELWGLDVGCRTSIIYSPGDLSCLWDKWTSFQVPRRPPELVGMITRASQVGVNIVAYVTGREVLNKLEREATAPVGEADDAIERDLVELRKVRYTGDWDAAPQALRRIMQSARSTAHLPVAQKTGQITLVDRSLHQYPLLYMHGRHDFQLTKNEIERLRSFLENGGFLFADACCGSPQFDTSFRALVKVLFPEQSLERVPVGHEVFLSRSGFELKTVRRREAESGGNTAALDVAVRTVEPFLEGISVNNRFVLIYSKYDISCALERQSSVACTGYVHEDAVKLAVNIVVYGLNQ